MKIITSTPLILFFLLPLILIGQTFTDVTSIAGVDSLHGIHVEGDWQFSAGAAWFDYNNDGDLDLYVANRNKANYLFKNNGDGTFTDVAAAMGVDDPTGDGGGVGVADFNNDGYPDIFLANCLEDKLFKNNTGSSFSDISVSSGITASGNNRGTSVSWGDYDKDGFLDIYVSHHAPMDYNTDDFQDYLFYNNGDETFTDVSSILGISNLTAPSFIGGWTDFDRDGDLDILLIIDCHFGNDPTTTLLFRNDGGDDPLSWNFTEVSEDTGIADCSNGMGLGVGDYNRDGYLDYVYTDIGPVNLFQNNEGSFTQVADDAGIDIQEFYYFTWGTSFLDFNNDGYQDIIMANGSNDIFYPWPNYLFENNGDGTFTDVASAMNMDDSTRTRGIIYGDYDNDGDLDVFLANYADSIKLKRNDINNGNHYIKINLEGVDSNKDGIGSFIKIKTPDGVYQYFETRSGSNLGGGDAPGAHFGLASNTSIDSIIITWPLGMEQILTNISADQTLTVVEPDPPLSVEYLFFEASPIEKEILLEWSTASETDNDVFLIQRSKDGKSFETIGSIDGQGYSNYTSHYRFIDSNPLVGDNYYRLQQVDFDGKASLSEVKWIWFNSVENRVHIYPNPLDQDNFTIQYSGEKEDLLLEVTDVWGRIVYKQNLQNNEGTLNITVHANSWTPGLYLVKLFGERSRTVSKLLKI